MFNESYMFHLTPKLLLISLPLLGGIKRQFLNTSYVRSNPWNYIYKSSFTVWNYLRYTITVLYFNEVYIYCKHTYIFNA